MAIYRAPEVLPKPARPPGSPKQVARERLAAGAQGGKAAVDEYDQARQQIDQARKQAISGMTRDAALVSGQGTLGSLGTIISAPALRQENDLRQAGATFRTQQAALQGATQTYATEADQARGAAIAEIDAAAARARAKGGGGGGGGGGGHGSSLTDAQVRSALMNAAFENRRSTIAALTGRIDKFSGIEKVVNAKRQALDARFARQTGAAVGDAVRDPVKRIATPGQSVAGGVGVSPEDVQAWQRMRDALIAQQAGTQEEPPALANIPTSDIAARTLALRSLANRTAYDTNRLAAQPLYPTARQIGYQSGFDPLLVDSLLGPKEEASFQNALKKLAPNSAQKPTKLDLAAIQRVGADPFAAAQALAQDIHNFPTDQKAVRAMFGYAGDLGNRQKTGKKDANGQDIMEPVNEPIIPTIQELASEALSHGQTYDVFADQMRRLPAYATHGRTVELALEMARQRWAALQARGSGQQVTSQNAGDYGIIGYGQ
jgi:hypothetical protein